MGTFDGLQIALSSLYAQRKGLDVTGQNLANVNTEGYSRQRVDMVSDSGPLTPALFSRWEGSGMGVRSGSVQRLRDDFLELRGYQEHATQGHLLAAQTALAQVEQTFGEPSDTGIASQLADFWAGWDDVANNPGDVAARSQLVQRAQTLASGLAQADATLAGQRQTTIDQVQAIVQEVNATAARIADLNATIQSATASGLTPNDLMDQRDALIGQLAERVGATVHPGDYGTVDVFVWGSAIVRGSTSEALQTATSPTPPNDLVIQWAKDGLPAAVDGRAAGMLDAVNDIIPRYRSGLAAIGTQVMSATNSVHTTGYDLYGNPGQAFFLATPSGGITVNPAIAADPKLVAAAASAGTLDGSVAAQLAGTTGPDDTYRSLVVQLGVESQSAIRRVDIQSAITKQVDAARDSVAGVNIDEEMTNLVQYQHAYDAAARFMTTVDQMLDTLIHGTGTVGR